MARGIGLAHGYAMCRCGVSPNELPEDIDGLLLCAMEEAGPFRNLQDRTYEPGAAHGSCAKELLEKISEQPMLEPAIRCRARSLRDAGNEWLTKCPIPFTALPPPPPAVPCPGVEDLSNALSLCGSRVTCNDGTVLAETSLCDGRPTCPDQSDEYRCFGVIGQDMVLCGGEVLDPRNFCVTSHCGFLTNPPVCDESKPRSFICKDGTEINLEGLCDRKADCPDETDEAHCFR
jgi:hypothetical protein